MNLLDPSLSPKSARAIALGSLLVVVIAVAVTAQRNAASAAHSKWTSIHCKKSSNEATATFSCDIRGFTSLRLTAVANMGSSLVPRGTCVSSRYDQIVPPTFSAGRIAYVVQLQPDTQGCIVRLLFVWSYKPANGMPLGNFHVHDFVASALSS